MAQAPHIKVLLGNAADNFLAASEEVEVALPKKMLLQLLELYLSCWDFEEEWYLSTYPDVRDAVKSGALESGWAHFKAVGYLEGRAAAPTAVDSDWYLEMYPDVAKAVIDGRVTDVQSHYADFGRAEGRFPRDPKIDLKWYKERYLSTTEKKEVKDYKDALDHFVRVSYLKFAVPAMPR